MRLFLELFYSALPDVAIPIPTKLGALPNGGYKFRQSAKEIPHTPSGGYLSSTTGVASCQLRI
jgi:hypothetical protein